MSLESINIPVPICPDTIKCPQHLHEAGEESVGALPGSPVEVSDTDPNAWHIGDEEQRQELTTTVVNISPEVDPAVIKLFEDAKQSRKWAESRVIKCNEDLTPATNDLAVMAKIKKELTEKKKEYTVFPASVFIPRLVVHIILLPL